MPGFPNLFMLYGPNTNLGHNSIIFMLECQVHYIVSLLVEMIDRRARSVEVTTTPCGDTRTIWTGPRNTVWADACDSWYKTATGRITNNWPHTTISYWRRTRHPEVGDFRFRTTSSTPIPDEVAAVS